MLVFCVIIISCGVIFFSLLLFFFFKQKTAYEMRISDWSSDVCSSDLYALSLHLDLEERQIHVIAPDVGGGFGIKNIVYPEEIAVAAVARHLRYPLRWIEDRREHLLSSIH